jgi:hypothetical protein
MARLLGPLGVKSRSRRCGWRGGVALVFGSREEGELLVELCIMTSCHITKWLLYNLVRSRLPLLQNEAVILLKIKQLSRS